MNRAVFAAVAPLLAAAAACAPRATRVASETAPRLIGCSGFQTDLPRERAINNFTVNVRVDQNGKVVPGSGVVIRRRGLSGNGERAQQARAMAETCTFEPATRHGVAVEARARIGVSVPAVGT